MSFYLRDGFIHFLSRITPFAIPIYTLLYAVLHDSKRAYLFFGGAIGSDVLNYMSKQFIYPLCSTKWYPRKLLGICARPSTPNVSCSIFHSIVDSHSYGMPSGHAQFAAFTAAYWILYLYNYHRYDKLTGLFIIMLILFSLGVSYSRVVLSNCHTIQQVCVGSLIGILLGIVYYYFSEWWLKRTTTY